jgi:flagellar motor switch protein FliM
MSKILSQDEIDALLTLAPGGESATRGNDSGLGGVITYNFRRPDRVSKDQIRSLHFLHDRFARNAASSLAAYLRAMTELSIVSVEQFSYSEFLMSLADPTAYYAFSMSPLDGLGALELNPTMAFTIVDRMLGGSGHSAPPNRALTEIEQNVVDAVVRLLIDHLTETWKAVFDLEFRIQGRETRPQMLQVVGPNEVVILLAFDLKIGDIRGMLNLCIPASIVEATGSGFVQGWQKAHRSPTATERQWLSANLGRVPLSVTTSIETRLRARELVNLKLGDVISLGVPVQSPVDVCVANRMKFTGRLTASHGQTAVRLEQFANAEVSAMENA